MKHESPTRSLSAILDALNDKTRRRILLRLKRKEHSCSEFGDLGAKSRLSYHFAVLQEAGLIRARREGTKKYLSLDRAVPVIQNLVETVLHAEESGIDLRP